jgi:hypothetical protein
VEKLRSVCNALGQPALWDPMQGIGSAGSAEVRRGNLSKPYILVSRSDDFTDSYNINQSGDTSYSKLVIPLPLSFLLFLFLALRFLVYNTSSSLASIHNRDNRQEKKNKKDLEIVLFRR